MPFERERIAHYRILSKLGSGGMGDVYLAEDERLSRQVALKVIAAEHSPDDTLRRRFLREAHAVASLSHPGIAHIYETGSQQGTDFIAMELVKGQTLAKRISGDRLSIDEILTIAAQLSDAIAEAHEHGIIHRDIKPSNIMITPRGRVKILDFGIARFDPANAESFAETDSASATKIGTIIGTANYMSPEQALGEPADRRSDVFSIGVVLYELITCRLPFAGKTAADTLHRITSAEPEPLARFNYELPIELERIVRKCLEKTAARRYRSARELHTDLAAIALDRSSTPSASWLARSPSSARGRRLMFAVGVLAVIIGVTATYLMPRHRTTSQASPPNLRRAVAVLPFTAETANEDDANIADGLTDRAINRLAEDPGMSVMARSTVFHFKGSDLLPQKIGNQLAVDSVVTGSLRSEKDRLRLIVELVNVKDGSRLWSHEYRGFGSDPTGMEYEVTNGLAEALHSPRSTLRPVGTGAARAEAHRWYLRGRIAFYDRQIPQALGAFQRATKVDPTYAPPYAALADVETVRERYNDVPASKTAPNARASAEKALALDPMLPEGHVALASVYDTYYWNWKDAQTEYRTAIRLRPSDPLAHQWYALLLARLGRHDEALREIKLAQSLDPLSVVVNTAVANILYYARQPEPAMGEIAKATRIDASFPLTRIQHGLLLDQEHRYGEAVALLATFGALPRESNTGMAALGIAAAHAGKTQLARELVHELEARAAEKSTEYFAAAVHAALGDRDAAIQWLERAYTAHSAYLGFANVDPALDPLRDEPRFRVLIKRIHLG
ncbi:MAG: eukaryotic-like serine/threonine-protein kinase [Thermoanaerobaculia bacterium]|jgi:serine/threonine protein kinase/Tfp pilus assembly protein PilF|nr:eukaryotic-like serine/threonine-protein kinase [Thermoanaerobaculia bacterium]